MCDNDMMIVVCMWPAKWHPAVTVLVELLQGFISQIALTVGKSMKCSFSEV